MTQALVGLIPYQSYQGLAWVVVVTGLHESRISWFPVAFYSIIKFFEFRWLSRMIRVESRFSIFRFPSFVFSIFLFLFWAYSIPNKNSDFEFSQNISIYSQKCRISTNNLPFWLVQCRISYPIRPRILGPGQTSSGEPFDVCLWRPWNQT